MPSYYIKSNLYSETTDLDELIELPDDHAAWKEATTSLGEILRNVDGKLAAPGAWEVKVIREDGTKIYSLRLTAETYLKQN
jgi:hypothetical protein